MYGGRSARRLILVVGLLPAAMALSGCEPPLCTQLETGLGLPGCGEHATLNSPPVIHSIVSTFAPLTGQRVEFTATADDPDHDELYYEWDLNGDGDFERAGYADHARTVATRYLSSAVINVKLRVSDFPDLPGGEGQATATKRIRVHTPAEYARDRAPVASFTIDPNPSPQGGAVSFDASASSDPDHDRLYYIWHFGDRPDQRDEGDTPTVMRTFGSVGTVDVQLDVLDEYGKSTRARQTLTVEQGPAAPRVALDIDPNPATVYQNVSFSAARSTDPNGDIVRYEWDLDGAPGYELTTTEPTTQRMYVEPKDFQVGVRVVDATDRASAVSTPMRVTSPDGGGRGTGPGARRAAPGFARATASRAPKLGRRRSFSARVSGTSSSGSGPALAGAGGLRGSLYGPRRLTKAERILKRFLAARWRTKLQVAVDKSAGRATADGLALATRARSPDRACVRVKIDARAGLLPHGTFTLLGGTGAAARLYSTASFRFRVAGKGPALIVGTLRAGRGRARGLPRKCARLAPK